MLLRREVLRIAHVKPASSVDTTLNYAILEQSATTLFRRKGRKMPVQVRWYNEDERILYYDFQGAWTWDEYFNALAEGRALMRSVDHRVCLLNDMRHATHIPSGFMSKAQTVVGSRPDNTGRVVFIATQTFFLNLLDTVRRVLPDFGANYYYEDTEEHALAHLQRWMDEQVSAAH
jgi:hypothetical protein